MTLKRRPKNLTILSLKVAAIKHQTGNFDEKVRFYTALPSYEVLNVVFEHVSPHVTRRTQSLTDFKNLCYF